MKRSVKLTAIGFGMGGEIEEGVVQILFFICVDTLLARITALL